MKTQLKLRIAVQKSGRLNSESMDLLYRCGLKIRPTKNSLYCHGENLPIDVLFVRDDDIPTLVIDGVCDFGIVGENVLFERAGLTQPQADFNIIKKLGFSQCRLSIAIPTEKSFDGPTSLNNLRIATSYPNLLSQYLKKNGIKAEIMPIAGSVEVAPRLDMAEAIGDLVATGLTLEENNLKEVDRVIDSQAVLIKTTKNQSNEKIETAQLLLRRIEGVLRAQESKYIMFHAPKESLPGIKAILPGCEMPSIMPLNDSNEKVAVHVVSREGVFWNTLEKLQNAGASSILVLPIEKMLN
jgi:ATP phosphoribosyltransferase